MASRYVYTLRRYQPETGETCYFHGVYADIGSARVAADAYDGVPVGVHDWQQQVSRSGLRVYHSSRDRLKKRRFTAASGLDDGHEYIFYRSGYWLIDYVPVQKIEQ